MSLASIQWRYRRVQLLTGPERRLLDPLLRVTPQRHEKLPVSNLSFDGSVMWGIANDGSLHGIDVDGGGRSQIGGVGPAQDLLAFDGSHVWVLCRPDPVSGHTLKVIDIASGTTIATHAPRWPWGIAFDGFRVWVGTSSGSTVSLFDAYNPGAPPTTLDVGGQPLAFAYDGRWMWVACYATGTVLQIDPRSLMTRTATWTAMGAQSGGPVALAYDGRRIWVANIWEGSLFGFATDGSETLGIPGVPAAPRLQVGSHPFTLAFDGTHLWVARYGVDEIAKVDPRRPALVENVRVRDVPADIAFDGTDVWASLPSLGVATRVPVAFDPG